MNYFKKQNKEPEIKIGDKKEKTLYSIKNISPELNLFNKQILEEEYLSNKKKQYQKEELSSISKCFQEGYTKPNLAHQRIDFDNVAGKIGQEKRQEEIDKYTKQRAFSKDQIFNNYNYQNSEKKKNIHSIINNTIFGFCDPTLKFPKTSYQSNFESLDDKSGLKVLSKMQYEDYIRFRKQQTQRMNKGNLGRNLRELPPRKTKQEIKEMKDLREKKYKENMNNLIQEQRLLDEYQARYLNQNNYAIPTEEYKLHLSQNNMNMEQNGNYYYNTINNENLGNYRPLYNHYEHIPTPKITKDENGEVYEHLEINNDPINKSNQIIRDKNNYSESLPGNNNTYYNNNLDGISRRLFNNYDKKQEVMEEQKEPEQEFLNNIQKYEDIIKDSPDKKYFSHYNNY